MMTTDALSLDGYASWLQERWEVPLERDGAVEEEAYDSRRPAGDPAALFGISEARDLSVGLSSDHATLFMGKGLRRDAARLRDRVVWEVGCGTGVLSALAGRLGARQVRATDIDARAVELARLTGDRNGVRVHAAVADLFRGSPWPDPADVLIADLPQKPVLGTSLPAGQDGGPDGSRHLLPFLEEAARRLSPEGHLFFFVHSLTHPRSLQTFFRLFRPRLRSYMWRVFERESYGGLLPYLERRREEGLCRYWDLPDGRYAFVAMHFVASRKDPA